MIEMQRQLDVKRHDMMDRENALRVKQSELENSIIKAKQREVSQFDTSWDLDFKTKKSVFLVPRMFFISMKTFLYFFFVFFSSKKNNRNKLRTS